MKGLNQYIVEKLTNNDSFINRFAYSIANLDDSDAEFLNNKLREIENKQIRNYLIEREIDIKQIENIIFGNNDYIEAMLEIISINSNPVTSIKGINLLKIIPQNEKGESLEEFISKFSFKNEISIINLLKEIFPIEIGAGRKVGQGEYILRILVGDYNKVTSKGVDIVTTSGNYEVKFVNTDKKDSKAKIFGTLKKNNEYIKLNDDELKKFKMSYKDSINIKYKWPDIINNNYLYTDANKKINNELLNNELKELFSYSLMNIKTYLSNNCLGEIVFIGNKDNINIGLITLTNDDEIDIENIKKFMIENNIKFYNFNKSEISVCSK